MDQPSEDILNKVRKLMALGASPSEAEAASALEKARVLLARYGLSLADVKTPESEVSETVLLEKQRFRTWELELIAVISKATFTQALRVNRGDQPRLILIGREVNLISAVELFNYLHLVVLKLGRLHSAHGVHVESFRRGVVHTIGERLSVPETTSASSPEDRQLVQKLSAATDRENADYTAQVYGKTRKKSAKSRVEADSYYRGRDAGNRVSLNRQLKSADS
jgi:hypothetical protein